MRRAWYGSLAVVAGGLALVTGSLGEAGLFVLFGVSALYFLRRFVRSRPGADGAAPEPDGDAPHERGGMPLAVIAVASLLLAGTAASFLLDASAQNPPGDGVCDYDRHPATALYERTAADGRVVQTRELCDEHIGSFLVLHPLQAYDLAAAPGVAFLGQPPAWWARAFALLWAALAALMLLASVNVGRRASVWDPVFVLCSLRRGAIAMAAGFLGGLLVAAAAVGLMTGLDDAVSQATPLGRELAATGSALPFYAATMVVLIALVAAFFGQRGRSG